MLMDLKHVIISQVQKYGSNNCWSFPEYAGFFARYWGEISVEKFESLGFKQVFIGFARKVFAGSDKFHVNTISLAFESFPKARLIISLKELLKFVTRLLFLQNVEFDVGLQLCWLSEN